MSNGESETLAGRNYKFIIEYRNVAGMKLEANTGTDVIKQEIELRANEQKTIPGIPAGTDYTIYEVIPDSADYSLEKVNVTKAGNDKNVKAENNVVTGIVVADDGDNPTSTEVTFVNTVTPLISISGTKTWEGGETKIHRITLLFRFSGLIQILKNMNKQKISQSTDSKSSC